MSEQKASPVPTSMRQDGPPPGLKKDEEVIRGDGASDRLSNEQAGELQAEDAQKTGSKSNKTLETGDSKIG